MHQLHLLLERTRIPYFEVLRWFHREAYKAINGVVAVGEGIVDDLADEFLWVFRFTSPSLRNRPAYADVTSDEAE
jgi:hypothetical protein